MIDVSAQRRGPHFSEIVVDTVFASQERDLGDDVVTVRRSSRQAFDRAGNRAHIKIAAGLRFHNPIRSGQQAVEAVIAVGVGCSGPSGG